jgi:hypothetical protein
MKWWSDRDQTLAQHIPHSCLLLSELRPFAARSETQHRIATTGAFSATTRISGSSSYFCSSSSNSSSCCCCCGSSNEVLLMAIVMLMLKGRETDVAKKSRENVLPKKSASSPLKLFRLHLLVLTTTITTIITSRI